MLELIAFLEDTFGIEVDTNEHELRDFDTVRKIAGLVAANLGHAGRRVIDQVPGWSWACRTRIISGWPSTCYCSRQATVIGPRWLVPSARRFQRSGRRRATRSTPPLLRRGAFPADARPDTFHLDDMSSSRCSSGDSRVSRSRPGSCSIMTTGYANGWLRPGIAPGSAGTSIPTFVWRRSSSRPRRGTVIEGGKPCRNRFFKAADSAQRRQPVPNHAACAGNRFAGPRGRELHGGRASSGGYESSYAIDIDRDTNGAGLFYFANYVTIMDRAERAAMRASGGFSDVAIDGRVVECRRIAYLGNVSTNDSIRTRVMFFARQEDPSRIAIRYEMRRDEDGELICLSESVKVSGRGAGGDADRPCRLKRNPVEWAPARGSRTSAKRALCSAGYCSCSETNTASPGFSRTRSPRCAVCCRGCLAWSAADGSAPPAADAAWLALRLCFASSSSLSR